MDLKESLQTIVLSFQKPLVAHLPAEEDRIVAVSLEILTDISIDHSLKSTDNVEASG